jgi:hypothetical protein
VHQVFIELGFKITRDHGTNASLQLYKNDLQVMLVDQTREFYAGKAKLWLSQDSCPDYMLKAEVHSFFILTIPTAKSHHSHQTAIMDEESRLKEYLHSSSHDTLMGAVHSELVSAVIEPLLAKDTGADYLFQKLAFDGTHLFRFVLRQFSNTLKIHICCVDQISNDCISCCRVFLAVWKLWRRVCATWFVVWAHRLWSHKNRQKARTPTMHTRSCVSS